uniref:Transposase n=1 Tax=Tenebrio molitor TaxID=7067 RepID=A0A8J6GWK8_TENMO|nr:hypothetical protein GEV33_015346 [Tenebrio molitor]
MGGRETRDKTKTHWTKTKTHYSPPGSQRPFLHKSAKEENDSNGGRNGTIGCSAINPGSVWGCTMVAGESSDLHPIEHVWDVIGRRLTTLHCPPQTLAQLQHEIQVAWDQVPQKDIDHLISSMPRRLNEYSGKAPSVLTVGVCRPPPEIFRELVLKDTSVAASAVRETEKGGLVIHPPPTPHRLFHRLIPVNFVVDCRLWFRIRSALDQTQ